MRVVMSKDPAEHSSGLDAFFRKRHVVHVDPRIEVFTKIGLRISPSMPLSTQETANGHEADENPGHGKPRGADPEAKPDHKQRHEDEPPR